MGLSSNNNSVAITKKELQKEFETRVDLESKTLFPDEEKKALKEIFLACLKATHNPAGNTTIRIPLEPSFESKFLAACQERGLTNANDKTVKIKSLVSASVTHIMEEKKRQDELEKARNAEILKSQEQHRRSNDRHENGWD